MKRKIYFNIDKMDDVMFDLKIMRNELAEISGVSSGMISMLLNPQKKVSMSMKIYRKLFDYIEKNLSKEKAESCFYLTQNLERCEMQKEYKEIMQEGVIKNGILFN